MNRVMVTGGAGFIGSRVVAWLLAEDSTREVIILDKMAYAAAPERIEPLLGPRCVLHIGDVTSSEDLDAALVGGVSGVVHCAAETHVDRSIDGPAPFVHTNVLGTFQLLERCRAGVVPRLCQVSTDEVYGDQALPGGAVAAAEAHDGLKGSSPYAATKSAGDLLALAYYRTYGTHVSITRGSNTYGPWQQPEKLMPVTLGHLADGKPTPLYGDGKQRRDWIYVDDHAAGICKALLHGEAGRVYHLGSGHLRSNKEVVEDLAAGLAQRGCPVPTPPWVCGPDRPGHDHTYRMILSELELPPGWAPQTCWRSGLAQLLDFTLSHPEWWASRGGQVPRWLAEHTETEGK